MVNAVWVRVPSLAPKNPDTHSGIWIFYCLMGLERPLRKYAGGIFLGRGRVLPISDASGTDVDGIGTFYLYPFGYLDFLLLDGTRKPDLSAAKVQNSPLDCFVGRGRVLPISDASGMDGDEIGTFLPITYTHPCVCFFRSDGTRKAVKKFAGTVVRFKSIPAVPTASYTPAG